MVVIRAGEFRMESTPPEGAVIRGGVNRFEDVKRIVIEVKPDRLMNLAYGIGGGEGRPHQVMRLDALGMDHCFEAARPDSCRTFRARAAFESSRG